MTPLLSDRRGKLNIHRLTKFSKQLVWMPLLLGEQVVV